MSAGVTFWAALCLVFWAVLIAELVGDKSMYTLASLALRFHWGAVFAAFTFASAAKMLVVTALSSTLVRFQGRWTYLLSAAAFFVSAILIWVDECRETSQESTTVGRRSKGVLICFGSFFFTEWGDPGQIAAAALTLKSHLLLATWIGGTLALMVKGGAALLLGLQIRNRLPQRALRILACGSCCILGIVAAAEGLMK